ncbi:MAG TPA: AAA domain-containing protein, partial [Candidatus Nanoarchaeia archaeon]|nr:AAA domain-containing protein [Candidatus Nanoarchaeia archaeon]
SEKGLGYRDLAVISPYKDQVEFIKKRIENNNIEVDTVDGFQGREKEIIILSLVRSNKNSNIGFLKDLRRLNVSITRAKKKLIIIGDSNTIKTNQTYYRLIDYIKENDGYFVI